MIGIELVDDRYVDFAARSPTLIADNFLTQGVSWENLTGIGVSLT